MSNEHRITLLTVFQHLFLYHRSSHTSDMWNIRLPPLTSIDQSERLNTTALPTTGSTNASTSGDRRQERCAITKHNVLRP